MHRRLVLGLAAVLLGTAAVPAHGRVLAQVSPLKLNLTVKPGDVLEQVVSVTNLGDEPMIVRPLWSDLAVDRDGQVRLLPSGSLPASLDTLARFEPSQLSLEPGETGQVRVTLRFPHDGPATRWGVLLTELRAARIAPAGLGPRIATRVGTTIYLSTVPVNLVRAELSDLAVTRVAGDSLAIAASLRNAGERHFYASGLVSISDPEGRTLFSGSMPTGVVLPGATRDFTWSGASGLPPGRYKVTATLDTGEPELTVGERWIDWQGAPGALNRALAGTVPH